MGGRRPKPAPGRGSLGLSGAQRLVGACAVVLLSATAGAWFAVALSDRDAPRAALPQLAGRIALEGLGHEVRIDRDRHGVPHIDAESERDAFFALGYSQAQDRLAQLLALRHRARGTASEQQGEPALDGDRLARLLDFRGLAERQFGQLPRAERGALGAYAAGVDARIERVRRGDELAPRGVRAEAIEPWRPQDSLAVFKLFAWALSGSIDASLVLNDLVAALGPLDAARFFPPRKASGLSAGRTTASAAPWLARGARKLRRAFGLAGHGVGSSAFVVGGAHTESGRPVLVADSHFEPTAPAALYLAHLRAPELDVAGATLAGVPVFWWGRNPHLAWACVNAGAVVTDLYTETLRAGGSEYHDGHRWRAVQERSEYLSVRRGADATLEVRSTAHGPILPPDGEAPREAISVAWSGARVQGASGIGSLLAVARAGDGGAVRSALRRHHEPPLALVYAAASGEAGLQVAGWIPHRTLAAQLLPLPGRARWYDWDEPVPFESLPAARISGQGFLIAADQPFATPDAAGPIDATWRSGARAARLEALLEAATRASADLRSLASLTGDDLLERSRELIDTALGLLGDAPRSEEAGELERWLREWDGHAAAGSVGSAVYHVFLGVLAEALFAPRLGPELYERMLAVDALDLEGLVHGVLRDAASVEAVDVWSDRDAVRAAIGRSLRETWLALSFRLGPDPRQWRWGRIHRLHFRDVASTRTLFGPFEYGGAPHAVQAAAYPSDSFDVSVAATARFAVDTGSLDLALTALAPGQSEHAGPGSAPEGLRDWLAGRYALVATRRLEIEDRSVAQLVLEPVR